MSSDVLEAFARLGDPVYWVAVLASVAIATITGLIPGVSGLVVMALSIPFILENIDDPGIGLVALATMTGVGNGLDTIPAILLGQPGSGNNVSFLEGHQLARQGKAAHTLGAVYAVSMMGGIIGAITLAIVIPIMKPFVLSFSWPEIAMFGIFGVAMVSGLSKGAMRRGLATGMLGLLIGTVGIAPATGDNRFIFQRPELWEGVNLIATTLGLFALPEMVDLTLTRESVAPAGSKVTFKEVMSGAKVGFKHWPIVIRQSVFGVFLGAIPGVGQATIDWLSYAFGIFWTKDKAQFGKGSLLGVIFAESAQNSKESGQAVPTLALGIPGGLSWALIIVAMLSYNIAPGPRMLGQNLDIVMLIIITLSIGNFILMLVGLGFTSQLAKLTLVPYPMVGAIVIPIVFLTGLISMTSWLFLPIMFVFMGMGLIMKYFQWPRPPMLLGLILGPIIEENLVSAQSAYGWGPVLTRPLTIALAIIAVGTLIFFSRTGNKAPEPDLTVPAGGSQEADQEVVHLSFMEAVLQSRNIPILLMIGGALAFIVSAQGFASGAQFFPVGAGVGIIILSLSQLYTHLVSQRTVSKVDIMDIGMKSVGMEGAKDAALKLTFMLVLFVLLMALVPTVTILGQEVHSLQWATFSYAILSPYFWMKGKWRYLGGLLAVTVVALFEFVIMNNFIFTIWPQASLIEWIGREIFGAGG